ncbi:hypothetical protein SBDP1_850025 [Syntrophobacter sp. SbD1]|nr:hypothetical protein SBDP1_850025 [Syntrophobacter sp. SbD1]
MASATGRTAEFSFERKLQRELSAQRKKKKMALLFLSPERRRAFIKHATLSVKKSACMEAMR